MRRRRLAVAAAAAAAAATAGGAAHLSLAVSRVAQPAEHRRSAVVMGNSPATRKRLDYTGVAAAKWLMAVTELISLAV